jgi:hypothetical protein
VKRKRKSVIWDFEWDLNSGIDDSDGTITIEISIYTTQMRGTRRSTVPKDPIGDCPLSASTSLFKIFLERLLESRWLLMPRGQPVRASNHRRAVVPEFTVWLTHESPVHWRNCLGTANKDLWLTELKFSGVTDL